MIDTSKIFYGLIFSQKFTAQIINIYPITIAKSFQIELWYVMLFFCIHKSLFYAPMGISTKREH